MSPDDRDENQGSNPATENRDVPKEPDPEVQSIKTTDPSVAEGPMADKRQGLPPGTVTVVQTAPPTTLHSKQAPVATHPSAGSHDQPHKPGSPPSSAWKRNLLTGMVALAFGVGGAWGYSRYEASASKGQPKGGDTQKEANEGGDSAKGDSSSSKGKGDGDASTSDPASNGSGMARASASDDLKGQFQHLSERLDALEQRLGSMSMPRDTNPPDLAHLRVRVGELSRTLGESAGLAPRLQQVEERLDRIQDDLKAIRDR